MGFLEVIIIVLGVVIFAGSFFLPDNQKEKEIKIPEEMIREMMDKEIKRAKFQIEEHLEETMEAARDKTERSMERLSNEKIKAIDEFSNTVIDRIYKNHEEAVFLYDMLSNKQVQIKHNIADLEKTARDGIRIVEEKIRAAEYGEKDTIAGKQEEMDIESKENEEIGKVHILINEVPEAELDKETVSYDEREEETEGSKISEPDQSSTERQSDEKNRVLELYKNGKSELEIAKELGLGIGEVKLIIGLFK